MANIVVQYLLDLQNQQNQTKEQQSIVFSSLTERVGTSSKGRLRMEYSANCAYSGVLLAQVQRSQPEFEPTS